MSFLTAKAVVASPFHGWKCTHKDPNLHQPSWLLSWIWNIKVLATWKALHWNQQNPDCLRKHTWWNNVICSVHDQVTEAPQCGTGLYICIIFWDQFIRDTRYDLSVNFPQAQCQKRKLLCVVNINSSIKWRNPVWEQEGGQADDSSGTPVCTSCCVGLTAWF